MTTALQLLTFGLGIICYSVSQLQQHGKLRLSKGGYGFWDSRSDRRKYKETKPEGWVIDAKDNWYTRLFDIKYKEAYLFSSNFLAWTTDGYHFAQFMFFNFIALSMTLAIGFNWWLLIWLLIGVRIVHAVTYRILQK